MHFTLSKLHSLWGDLEILPWQSGSSKLRDTATLRVALTSGGLQGRPERRGTEHSWRTAGGRIASPRHRAPLPPAGVRCAISYPHSAPKPPSPILCPESKLRHRRGAGSPARGCLGRLGELLARQIPWEQSPPLVPPGVEKVVGSSG